VAAVAETSLERRARALFHALPYRQYGRCSLCGRVRDDDDRPLLVAARVRGAWVCLGCWDLAGAPGRRPR
jgi:hypothetical protein